MKTEGYRMENGDLCYVLTLRLTDIKQLFKGVTLTEDIMDINGDNIRIKLEQNDD